MVNIWCDIRTFLSVSDEKMRKNASETFSVSVLDDELCVFLVLGASQTLIFMPQTLSEQPIVSVKYISDKKKEVSDNLSTTDSFCLLIIRIDYFVIVFIYNLHFVA